MVLFVRRRIHCGMGRFCFCALASFCLVRNDLWDCGGRGRVSEGDFGTAESVLGTYRHRAGDCWRSVAL